MCLKGCPSMPVAQLIPSLLSEIVPSLVLPLFTMAKTRKATDKGTPAPKKQKYVAPFSTQRFG